MQGSRWTGSDFDRAFEALTASGGDRNAPFPWQRRLFERFCSGDMPAALDLPTGLGKTSVMALWLLALAVRADLPRRLVYVVDRRTVVDQATAEAERLRANLDAAGPDGAGPDGAILAPVCRALLALCGTPASLPGRRLPGISTLRGRFADNRDWREDPAAPAIVVGTVDMIGSRLLFEGYGVSRGMRPLHAGLLGTDALVVLDESHLVPPFAALLDTVATDPALAGRRPLPRPRLRLMALSATQRAPVAGVFRLEAEDRAHPEIARRLGAAKRLELRKLDGALKDGRPDPDALAEALAGAARHLLETATIPQRVIVFADSRRVAESVHAGLSGGDRDRVLFTGARRARERSLAEADLRAFGFLAGGARPARHVVLVATSAAEVGVDLDADHGAMDLVPWERMVQRLGRINRRGRGAARVLVLDPAAPEASSGAPLDGVRGLLTRLPAPEPANGVPAAAAQDAVAAAPEALAALAAAQPALVAAASTAYPLRPALTRPLLEGWSLTGLDAHTGRPAIAPWLRGWIDEDEPQLRIVWRRHLPRRAEPPVEAAEVDAFFAAAPVHLTEILETEAGMAFGWLHARARARGDAAAGDAAAQDAVAAIVLDAQGELLATATLADLALFAGPKKARDRRAERRREAFERAAIRGTLVLDAALGGLRDGSLDATVAEPPATADTDPDWSELVGFRVRRTARLDHAATAADAAGPARAGSDPEAQPGVPELSRFTLAATADGEPAAWLAVERVGTVEAAGDLRSRGAAVTLAAHTRDVVAEVERIADALGLPEVEAAALGLAARFHDRGKAAAIWQAAMRAPATGGPWAKTPRGDGRALGGYRHETGSLIEALAAPELAALPPSARDLALHLIAAHHGHGRPLLGLRSCEALPPSGLEPVGLEAALRFARLQAEWGPWGLAWWEVLLRAADQRASRLGEARACRDSGGAPLPDDAAAPGASADG